MEGDRDIDRGGRETKEKKAKEREREMDGGFREEEIHTYR